MFCLTSQLFKNLNLSCLVLKVFWMSCGLIFFFLPYELFCALMDIFYNQRKGRETHYLNFLQLINLITQRAHFGLYMCFQCGWSFFCLWSSFQLHKPEALFLPSIYCFFDNLIPGVFYFPVISDNVLSTEDRLSCSPPPPHLLVDSCLHSILSFTIMDLTGKVWVREGDAYAKFTIMI